MFLLKRNGIFHLEYFNYEEGKVKRVSTRTKVKREALKFLMEFERNPKIKTPVKQILLEDFKDQYCQHIKINLSHKYFLNVDLSFRQLIDQAGNIPLSKLNYQLLDKFFTETFSRTKQGAVTYYRIIKSALNKAVSWGYIETNPMKKISTPKIPMNNPLFINDNELKLIIETETNQTMKDIYLFLYHTGMRIGEAVNLKWNQISITERMISVSNTKEFTTKGKTERNIPINETLFVMLQSRFPKIISLQKNELLFSKNGLKYNSEYISKKFKKAVRESGIRKDIHLHNLRHSFASNLAKKNISIFIIKELLGHKDVKTTQVYSHLTVESLKDAVKVLEY